MPLKYAIIEDEPPARSRLKRLIQELRPDGICLAEAEDGESGFHLLRMSQPDVLFLDIEFPPSGAFGMLRRASDAGLALPPIVFATAFDRYAIDAFRWAAWDYLLKPIERERLEESILRIEARVPTESNAASLLQTIESLKRSELPERFTVTLKGHLRVLAWADVTHLSTENRLVFVHTPEGKFVLDRALDELEKALTPRFFRSHRSAMVALDRVKELIIDSGGTGELRLINDARVPVSRDRMAELRRKLG